MTLRPVALLLPLIVLWLAGCESGLARTVRVTVPSDSLADFTEASPGVVVAELGSQATAFVVLCGQELPSPLVLSQDLGFGCVGDREGTTEEIRVWVQPSTTPAGDDLVCSDSREYYNDFAVGGADGGTSSLADTPETGWLQGTASGTWRGDFSPCGGVLNTELTLSVP